MEFTRLDTEFQSGPTMCAAWLYMPKSKKKKLPVVVMAHGFGGTRRLFLERFAELFAQRGMAVFVFDYRHMGDSGGYPRQLLDIKKQLEDWRAAINHVRYIDGLDDEKLALWGTSLSGGHVVATAAKVKGIKAVVAQVPFVDSRAGGEPPKPGIIIKFLLAAWKDLCQSALAYGPHYIPVVGPQNSFAFITSPGSWEAFEDLVTPEMKWRNEVTARTMFSVARYRPIQSAAGVNCPVLLVPARGDNLIPLAAVEKMASKLPDAKLVAVDGGHFDVYGGDLFNEVSAIEADFLAEHLLKKSN